MPVTKQAVKRMRQAEVRRARNRSNASRMKSLIKLLLTHVQKEELEKAAQLLPDVVFSIDSAAKKFLIHRNNAAHKKSRLQKAVNQLAKKKGSPAASHKKTAPKKTAATKKAASKPTA